MYPSAHARELSALLRMSTDLDIVGDVSVTVNGPSELLAWANILPDPTIVAWRAHDTAGRFIQVTSLHERNPVHGRVTAVLNCELDRTFWETFVADAEPDPGKTRTLQLEDLSTAWAAMPLSPPDVEPFPKPPG